MVFGGIGGSIRTGILGDIGLIARIAVRLSFCHYMSSNMNETLYLTNSIKYTEVMAFLILALRRILINPLKISIDMLSLINSYCKPWKQKIQRYFNHLRQHSPFRHHNDLLSTT